MAFSLQLEFLETALLVYKFCFFSFDFEQYINIVMMLKIVTEFILHSFCNM